MSRMLEVRDLRTYFFTGNHDIKAVDGISFNIEKGETLAIVGESGSGKSVTAMSLMRLIEAPGKIIGGAVKLNDISMLDISLKQVNSIRGNKIAMIFQDPANSLNPVIGVGEQIREVLKIHKKVPKNQTKTKAIDLMKLVKIPEAERRYNDLPSKFSGGMKQRIMIAIAIACNPEILISDESTTALDVTTQADILKLLNEMKIKLGMGLLLITHDLGIVAEHADRVIVMYCGKVMEEGDVVDLFEKPLHPYTKGLLKCIPRVDIVSENLYSIPGFVPQINQFFTGCSFSTRCEKVMDICREKTPELMEVVNGQKVRCWLYNK